jgi:hypothetical protein
LTRRKKDAILLSPIPKTLATLLHPGELMTGTHIEDFMSQLVSSSTNMSFIATYFGPSLGHKGKVYWDYPMGMTNANYVKIAMDVKDIEKHILYIPWATGRTSEGHWTLILPVRYKNTNGKVVFYHMDSLNNFDSIAPYPLPTSPLCSQKRDSWQNVSMEQQTELECVMILCLAYFNDSSRNLINTISAPDMSQNTESKRNPKYQDEPRL